jgi:hypothetical protein
MQNKSKFLALCLLLMSHAAWSDDGIDITDADQVSALLAVQEKIDSLSSSVKKCMDSGKYLSWFSTCETNQDASVSF